MSTFTRAITIGMAYGLCAAAADLWIGGLRMMELNMPAMPLNSAKAAALEIGLGAALGLAAWPVLIAVRRESITAIAIAATWTALSYTVAVDPTVIPMWLMTPAIALLALLVCNWLGWHWPRLPLALGAIALSTAIAVPSVSELMREGPDTRIGIERGTAAPDAPDVLVIVLDTVRAANMSTYGYERETSPAFSRLAAEGALFMDATSPSTWSLPSHGSLFTGWFPSAHSVHGEHRMLGPHPPTLAEVFYRNGYDTLCFTANPHISDGFGLTRGFAWSDRAYLAGNGGRSFMFIYRALDLFGLSASDKGGAQVTANFEHWLDGRSEDDKPAFVFINFLEAHFPYHQVPADFLATFTDSSPRELREFSLKTFGAQFGRQLSEADVEAAIAPTTDMYDAGVLYSDYLLDRVTGALRVAGRLDDTVLIVLADHGELLGEHGQFGHGQSLHQPDLHVPLMIRYPAKVPGGTRVTEPVSTVGVYATALELAEVEPPGPLHVASLLPALKGEPAGQPVIAERFLTPMRPPGSGSGLAANVRYRVYRSGALKLVETNAPSTYLYDVAGDPFEQHDLAADAARKDDLERLRGELAAWVDALDLPSLDAEIVADGGAELDPATRERLKALGYID